MVSRHWSRRFLGLCLLACSLSLFSAPFQSPSRSPRFCGAWIATVANIDWPKANTVGNSEQQQVDLVNLIDSLSAIGINAVIFQVRPTADALYQSSLEPVSHWLTGKQSFPLNSKLSTLNSPLSTTLNSKLSTLNYFDPLALVLREAHKRQMEVHAWLNPFRVNIAAMSVDGLAEDHIMHRHPEWFWKYGKQYYFDPGLQETRDWICAVVKDIVTHYDVDAIHMDDYFYPYPIAGQRLPDEPTFRAHARGHNNIEEWRRDNVNLTIEQIAKTIRSVNPRVRFGISPFGIYETNYKSLYADVLLWAKEGWIDYLIPQLYWSIDPRSPATDYATLAAWWSEQLAPYGTALYTGHAVYRLGEGKSNSAWLQGNEVVRQKVVNRSHPEISGECYYSAKYVLTHPDIVLMPLAY